jgi:hypothetical protein
VFLHAFAGVCGGAFLNQFNNNILFVSTLTNNATVGRGDENKNPGFSGRDFRHVGIFPILALVLE